MSITSFSHLSSIQPRGVSQQNENAQFTLRRILLLWLIVALPMALITWVLVPALVIRLQQPAIFLYWMLVILAMLWQFALSLWIVHHEQGTLRWSTLCKRTWLVRPRDPQTGQRRLGLFLWLIPFILIAGLVLGVEVFFSAYAPYLLRIASPSTNLPILYSSNLNVLDWSSPEFTGKWWLLGLAFVAWILSSFLGEEFFFRGILLPKMAGTFGKRDWLANSILFGLYHLDKLWTIPFRLIESLAIVIPAHRFRSNWMAVGTRAAEGVALFAVIWLGVTSSAPPPLPASLNLPHIATQPYANRWRGGRLDALPSINPSSTQPFQIDLRSYDLTGLDLRESRDTLLNADFDTRTRWPSSDHLPPDFDPAQILELGKNPGLGVRSLHTQGIAGRGVGIGIIDQPLLTEHQEYADQLRWYEELPSLGFRTAAEMHGPAVASIAVGKTVGVALEADLYYVGVADPSNFRQYAYFAQGIRRLLEINDRLPLGRKIRAISMSLGIEPQRAGYSDVVAAIKEANGQGILTIYPSKVSKDGVGYQGLGRAPLADPDVSTSYEPGLFWAPNLYAGRSALGKTILVPMDARTTAGWGGADEYVFYRAGGMSWPTPYIAGVYALAAQVNPKITPDRFWALAIQTGHPLDISREGKSFRLESVIDPSALIAALEK